MTHRRSCQESAYVGSLLRFYKWHVLATKKENRGREEMYCFPRLKDLPTPHFVF